MVSGLVTSPCDQEDFFSGLAKLMRMESKSAIKLARSLRAAAIQGCFLPPLPCGCGLRSDALDRLRTHYKLPNSVPLPGRGAACCAPTLARSF